MRGPIILIFHVLNTLTPFLYSYIDNNSHTHNSDVILVMLPEISEQLLFPIY
jgi:hypothetical protein